MKKFGTITYLTVLHFILLTAPGCFAIGPIYNLTNNETGLRFMVLDKADDADTVTEARVKCRAIHILADVAELTNASDDVIVQRLINIADDISGNHWLGISDVFTEGKFLSLRTGQRLTYTAWKDGTPPEDINKNCAIRNSVNGEWDHESCHAGRGVLCSLPDPIPPIGEALIPGGDNPRDCLPTWIPYNNSCYLFHPHGDKMNFNEVISECQGGEMMVPYSPDDVNFLQLNGQLSGISSIWLGIWDKGHGTGNYRSVYLSGGATPYLNWASDEPKTNDGHDNCVVMETDISLFKAKSCTENHGIVCKDFQVARKFSN
ncbi:macrophage mannose receptor 1-like [Asterias rubens]|uniref:macrophage mannose receptor 1-like n=1 Tax=Asterias rubens TaxID=7604 RepID=UPI0014553673|nr:macrophage mannose receptor 1-like [Asterias rubens]